MKNFFLFFLCLSALALPAKTAKVNVKKIASRRIDSNPEGTVSVIIKKIDYELNVYDSQGWYATFPVVFGNNDQGDKMIEGDRKTPEGVFHIANKRIHGKWDRYMGLDYPTVESYAKFKLRKQAGQIPVNAHIGGGIGIHGTWPHDDYIIDQYQNWTLGCISLKCTDVEELYSYLPVGTKITIEK